MIPWESCALWFGYPLQNGIWPDVSKHDNDGIITGAVWESDSLEFDGIDDIVCCGSDNSLDITTQITIEVLIKPYSAGEGGYGHMVSKVGSIYLQMIVDYRARLFLYDSLGASHVTRTNVNALLYNKWSHLVCTYDGAIQKLYVNGILQTETASWSGTIKSVPDVVLQVGNRQNGLYVFEGKIAVVRIFNKAFVLNQVQEAYRQCYRLI